MEFIVVKIGIAGMSKSISDKYTKSIKKAFKKVDMFVVYLSVADQSGIQIQKFDSIY